VIAPQDANAVRWQQGCMTESGSRLPQSRAYGGRRHPNKTAYPLFSSLFQPDSPGLDRMFAFDIVGRRRN
jgi:hypothetical protein